ncbi:protein-disulfide reductase DsbD domain-containing protein [Pseudomonas paraeruginosa]|uniref:protein-disulfide reductase DsbD family protein n=2 Tax=Pseudomonas aeruginosa group TaxID=136841 RepID=UPI00071B58C5|nr:protein-disulfide reductase DsbD domain-containing protein [Pseudomonas aeruginosa]KSF80948.1 thiol:disulfide interchange protein [Pseudomonas aeruginosa]PTC38834.1 Cytochrome c-type biogenesis protein DsbD, protein-disulfide reductase [Pseudomonas aeruginosa]
MRQHRRLFLGLAALLALLAQGSSLAAQGRPEPPVTPIGERHMKVTLELENAAPAPGTRTTLALLMEPERGWHGYWKTPGDAGFPNDVQWRLPKAASIGDLQYPVPRPLLMQGLMNHVYEGPYALLATLRIPADARPGEPLPISARLRYLVCTERSCVPESANVETIVTPGDAATPDPARQARFDGWRRALPRPLRAEARYEFRNGRFRLGIPLPATVELTSPHVFPLSDTAFGYAAAQRFSRNGDTLVVEMAGNDVTELPAFSGVLGLGNGAGLAIQARPGSVPAAGQGLAVGDSAPQLRTTLLALLGAILGGLLLNVMPCVFPILSLKVLSLAKANPDAYGARNEALAYTAGAVLVCLALGAVLMALRALGSEIGWAFQLQNPAVILLLILLTSAMGLNLAGLFELGSLSAGSRLAGQDGPAGAFWTGGLAAFVGTPCSGPFMAGALGAALVLPPLAGLLVFAGLGFGLALPFLLLSFAPVLQGWLPRPGAWMQTLRRVLAIPLFASTVWLVWVLGRQTGVDGAVLGIAAALLLGLGLWFTGLRQQTLLRLRWWPAFLAMLLALGCIGLLPSNMEKTERSAKLAGEPFDQARLAALQAEGRPVFLYFTADWCLTCKVNERVAIDRQDTRQAFSKAGVVTMIGDWTDGDPQISRFITAHGHSGVPFYLWQHADGRTEILPQLLTPDSLPKLARDIPQD